MICYIILTFSAFGDRNNVISPSEMYHDIFQKENSYDFLEKIDTKGMADKSYMHKYLILTFLCFITLLESIWFVKDIVLNRDLSLLC